MKKIKNFIITFLFPNECILCGKLLKFNSKENICEDCVSELAYTDFKPILPLGEVNNKKVIRFFYSLASPFNYATSARKGIIGLKFKGRKGSAGFFAEQMVKLIKSNEFYNDFDYIIPVPVSRKKLQKRGYNQCELIAKKISEIIDKPLMLNNLVRIKDTKTQSLLTDKQDRVKNVKGIFKVRDNEIIKNNTILLIDDVYTTGATVNECSRILKEAGAKRVLCVTASVRLPKKRIIKVK